MSSKMYERTVTGKKHKKYKINIEAYGSANEVAEDCKRRKRKSGGWEEPDCGDWAGVENYDEALGLLRNGYQPAVKSLKDKLKIGLQGNGKRMSFQNSVQGFTPVVPLALKGVPNSMVDMRIKPIKNKVIDVYYDMTVHCGVKSKKIHENGENVLGAILELEAQGYKFNLYAMQTYSDENSSDVLVVKIKSSNQPLDIKRMSFPLTHPAFFRVIGFDWYGKTPNSKYRWGYGHSITVEFENESQEVIKQLFGQNAVAFFGSQLLDRNQEYIKEVLINAGSKNR